MNLYWESKRYFQVIAILLPWENPICIPSMILALIIGFPMLLLGIFMGLSIHLPSPIRIDAIIHSITMENNITTLQAIIGSCLFGLLFLFPFLLTLSQTKIKLYKFSPFTDELRVIHWWLKHPFKIYRCFTQPLHPIEILSLEQDSTTVSGGPSTSGYNTTPITLSWTHLICKDKQEDILAMLEIAYTDKRLLRRINQFLKTNSKK